MSKPLTCKQCLDYCMLNVDFCDDEKEIQALLDTFPLQKIMVDFHTLEETLLPYE